MWYVVNGLVIGAVLGAAVFAIGVLGFATRRWSRLSGFVASGALLRRGAIFGIVTFALGASLHMEMRRHGRFVHELPTALLALDVHHERYASVALGELSERSVNQTLNEDKALRISDALLEERWWRDGALATPFPRTDPVQNWFAIQLEKGRMSDTQLTRWLEIVEPPGVLRIESTSASWDVVSEWGRQWQREADTPYRIDRLIIDSITVNGAVVEFDVFEDEESESQFGWEAPVVRFYAVLPMESRRTGESNVVEVRFRLDVEPGTYRGVGPLVWRGAIVPN